MTRSEPHKPADPEAHAGSLLELAARLGDAVCAQLTSEHPIAASALGREGMGQNALSGLVQYALLYCALEKILINAGGGDLYWVELHRILQRAVSQAARASAEEILTPLSQWAGEDEMACIRQATTDPLRPFQGTSLSRLDQGLTGTPLEVLTRQVAQSFYSPRPPAEMPGRLVELCLSAIKVLLTDGGLVG